MFEEATSRAIETFSRERVKATAKEEL